MRQSAGKRSVKAVFARGRAAQLNQAAIVTPTLARLTPVARASSTLLLKTASCTRSPIGGSSLPVLKVYRPRPSTRNAPQVYTPGSPLGSHLPRRFRRVGMLDAAGNLPKNGDILTPKTVGTTHRTQEENGQNQALKNTTLPR